MGSMLEQIKKNAASLNKTIVLCEGEDKRVIDAAAQITKEGVAKIVLVGNYDECKRISPDADLTGVTVIDPEASELTAKYANILYEARKSKGMTPELALEAAKDRTMFGALMLKAGDVDGYVSGACHSTANTLRPGLQVIKTAPNTNIVSSCFIMIAPENGNEFAPDGALVFGDCALNICPTAEQLAEIAVSSAQTAKSIAGLDPKVAMLSFSTKGSGNDAKFYDTVTKVQQATAKAKELAPELKIDGEYQFDAAIVPKVAKIKAPDSEIAGQANVFVFPDINAGNIGYKIAERLGGFIAVGPICQGFAKPLNDLSRGCSTDDIVLTVAVTALQAGAQK
ncbi:MAG: phosphate acetyltransferase [Clostridia bacterium]|nr:phosphate acetyltransferase [Clostridia bacterium]